MKRCLSVFLAFAVTPKKKIAKAIRRGKHPMGSDGPYLH